MDRHFSADSRVVAANQTRVAFPKQRLFHDSGVKIGEPSQRDIYVARLQASIERALSRGTATSDVRGAFVSPFMEARQGNQVPKADAQIRNAAGGGVSGRIVEACWSAS